MSTSKVNPDVQEGVDICSECGAAEDYGTMAAKSETDFDLLCQKCVDNRTNGDRGCRTRGGSGGSARKNARAATVDAAKAELVKELLGKAYAHVDMWDVPEDSYDECPEFGTELAFLAYVIMWNSGKVALSRSGRMHEFLLKEKMIRKLAAYVSWSGR